MSNSKILAIINSEFVSGINRGLPYPRLQLDIVLRPERMGVSLDGAHYLDRHQYVDCATKPLVKEVMVEHAIKQMVGLFEDQLRDALCEVANKKRPKLHVSDAF